MAGVGLETLLFTVLGAVHFYHALQAFTGKYYDHHEKGTYQCVCCGSELFRLAQRVLYLSLFNFFFSLSLLSLPLSVKPSCELVYYILVEVVGSYPPETQGLLL